MSRSLLIFTAPLMHDIKAGMLLCQAAEIAGCDMQVEEVPQPAVWGVTDKSQCCKH